MFSTVAKDLDQQIRSAIYNKWLFFEARRTVHITMYTNDLLYLIKVSYSTFKYRN